MAVLDAAARLSEATEPAVRTVLQRIIDDESRHAALAWRTLAWLLEDDDGTVRARLAGIIERRRLPAVVIGAWEELDAA